MSVPYAAPLVRLLKGPVYADARAEWSLLLRHRAAIEEWFGRIDLELVLAEHDGLAFVRRSRDEADPEADGEAANAPGRGETRAPSLVTRRELPFLASLLCVLLVEELRRFESGGSDGARLVLELKRIRELALPFLPKRTNEARQSDAIDAQVKRLEEYGFVRRIAPGSDEFEVTRLLKYKIDAEAVAESLARLKSFAAGLDADAEGKDGDDGGA